MSKSRQTPGSTARALRAGEAQMRFALETLHAGAWELNLRDHTARRTPIHDRIFGYETLLPNWTYEAFLDHVLPEDRPEVDRLFHAATAAQSDWAFECRIRRTDGAVRWIWAAGAHVRGPDGQAVRMSGIVQDITERKIAEERLRHLNDVLRAVRNVNQLITHEKDRDTLLRRACEILTETRGYRTAWIGLRDARGCMHAAAESGVGPGFAAILAQLERGDGPACCRLTLEQPGIVVVHDTRVNCANCPLAPTYGETAALVQRLHDAGKDYGVLVVALPVAVADDEQEQSLFRELGGDISFALHAIEVEREGQQAEEALLASKAKLEAALDSMTDAVFISDAEGRFIDFNEAFATFHKFRNKAECARTFAEYPALLDVFMANGERAPVEQWAVPRALRGETVRNAAYTLRRRDTGETWVGSYSFAPIRDRNGAIVGSVCTASDITRELDLEAQLLQAQKLEAIGTLASGVAHEINNPIMGIVGFAQLIADELGADSRAGKYALEIDREAHRVATIVRNLLAFARQDQETQRSPARLRDIVESTRSLIGVVLKHDAIALDVVVPGDLPEILCRSQQIQQVIMNLLTNARDALNQKYAGRDPNKKILIEARQIEKDGCKWVRTTVTDHGTGIPENLRARIFDPFFTTKPRDKGTGLGLSISHGIVKAHGGELSVESEIGQWSKFHVDLKI